MSSLGHVLPVNMAQGDLSCPESPPYPYSGQKHEFTGGQTRTILDTHQWVDISFTRCVVSVDIPDMFWRGMGSSASKCKCHKD